MKDTMCAHCVDTTRRFNAGRCELERLRIQELKANEDWKLLREENTTLRAEIDELLFKLVAEKQENHYLQKNQLKPGEVRAVRALFDGFEERLVEVKA